jgi:hypothetical protein
MCFTVAMGIRRIALLGILCCATWGAVQVKDAAHLSSSRASCNSLNISQSIVAVGNANSIDDMGCADGFAWVWATIQIPESNHGGPPGISVTEVMQFDPWRNLWVALNRAQVCRANQLPRAVYEKGCFSN